ncbi:hypothetical protein EHE19_007715 [Ruminiclostridium herbifermentans]|uniref:Domain X domain-containing protein n=1 Tax=Ruminiclostridium herbifermentans TaxID=2488810 RepID=A0A4U7JK63_9FIRM|nr:hypothetical protein EHE19_007715 [Ruminiclostridium herbifermentans]
MCLIIIYYLIFISCCKTLAPKYSL